VGQPTRGRLAVPQRAISRTSPLPGGAPATRTDRRLGRDASAAVRRERGRDGPRRRARATPGPLCARPVTVMQPGHGFRAGHAWPCRDPVDSGPRPRSFSPGIMTGPHDRRRNESNEARPPCRVVPTDWYLRHRANRLLRTLHTAVTHAALRANCLGGDPPSQIVLGSSRRTAERGPDHRPGREGRAYQSPPDYARSNQSRRRTRCATGDPGLPGPTP